MMNENVYIEEMKQYCFRVLDKEKIIKFEAADDTHFIVEYQEKEIIIQIIVRGLYNTDFEIWSMKIGGIIYFDYVFYGSNGKIKFTPEIIVRDWKCKLDAVLLLYTGFIM